MSWIPLHVHSQYSILDSTASVKKLAEKAASYGMEALALTDQGNLFGAVDFFKACSARGIKPIIGCELYVAPQSRLDKMKISGQRAGYPIVLLAKDKIGYQNLCHLSSYAHLEGFYYTPRIDKELLEKYHEGLICLSGPMRGKIAELIVEDKEEELNNEISFVQNLFGDDFYLELTRHPMSEEQMRLDGMDRENWLWQASIDSLQKQEKVFDKLLTLSGALKIPCVATNDSRYIDQKDWRAHEILVNVSSGEPVEIWERDSQGNLKNRILNPKRKVCHNHELYFKSPEQMAELFKKAPQALSETIKIAEKCEFAFDFKSKFYPVYVPPHLEDKKLSKEEREKEAADYLKKLCNNAIPRRYDEAALEKVREKYPENDPLEVVQERLSYELDLIISKGLTDYLLIVYDFIDWAKKKGIPVGPGRGSGAGSIICYLTEITDIEPLRFNLFFERFINPERVSYPDIDVDICMDRRSEVIDYTVKKYGKDKVAQIITFGTMKAKMAVKDVGRVLSVPLSKVNELAKLIPEDPGMTLDKALELDADFLNQYESDEETRRLIDLAKTLEGSVRNTGIHAAGLIISADPLMEHIPVCNAKDADVVATQYAMKPVEAVGMLKIDFLGLKTLTAIQVAVDAISKREGKKIDWVNLPLDDKATYSLLNTGRTLGLFQFESGGMQELIKQLHIDTFEEIIAVGALYRPGPMEMIPSFIKRKHGQEKIELDHPKLADILNETYGIMVYQEQVMMMAQKLAGYSLGEGDVLRRAMGKKDKEEMARQKEKFRIGAMENGMDQQLAIRIFDKVEKFASYGFNKSHAAAYGYLSYVTAYLKANYPSDWMASLMTTDRDDLSKVSKVIRECQAMNIAILPPDVNESGTVFLSATRGIRFAITAIKGVGEGVVETILEERQKNGAFKSLYDFLTRVDTQKVGKKVVENLIDAGAFDFTGWNRGQLIASVEPMFQVAQKEQKEKKRGEMNFLAMIEEEDQQFSSPPEKYQTFSKLQMLRREKELLGFYVTGHPLDDYENLLQRLSCVSLDKISTLDSGTIARVAFVIETSKVKMSRSNRKFAILNIGDGRNLLELPVWSDIYEEKSHLLEENQLIYAVLQIENEPGEQMRLQCRWIDDLTKSDEAMIEACDLAYDRARMKAKISQMQQKNKKAKPKMNDDEEKSTLILKMSAPSTRLSHILDLKRIFRSFPGKAAVALQFWSEESQVAEVFIESNWGVSLSKELHTELEKHPAIDNMQIKR